MQNSKENFNSEVFSLSFQTTNIWTSTFFLQQLLFPQLLKAQTTTVM